MSDDYKDECPEYDDYRKYRGAFGPIMEKEVEAAFRRALAVGREQSAVYENSTSSSLVGKYQALALRIWKLFPEDPLPNCTVHFWPERLEALLDRGLLLAAQGPFQPTEAFEVWERSYRREAPGGGYSELQVEALPPAFGGATSIATKIMRAAFLAGAQYGAAATSSGEEHTAASSERPEATLRGSVASDEADREMLIPTYVPTYDERKVGGRKYRLTNPVHPETVVRWFLELKHFWFDGSLGPNMFTGQWNAAFKFLCGWIETGEMPPDHTTLEISLASKFQEWLNSSWEVVRAPNGGPNGGPISEQKTPAIPSHEEWKIERCRALVFAILGGLSVIQPATKTIEVGDDVDSTGDHINELRELWETI